MNPRPVALQLYTLRDAAAKGFPAVLEKTASFGYCAVEFAGLHGMAPQAVRRILDDLGLIACSNHGPMPDKNNLQELVDQAKALGYQWNVTSIGPDRFADEAATRRTAEALQEAAELLKAHGLRMAYHNHWWEFDKQFGGKTPHEILMEQAPSLYAQLDTYWAQVGGQDAADVVRRLGNRAPLLHIKDGPAVRDQPMTAVGAGKMDWQAVFAAADATLQWPIVELDSCATDMLEAARESARYLVAERLVTGR